MSETTEQDHKQDEAILAVRGLAKTFATDNKVLDGIDLDVRPGEAVAMIGPSGAGKTTFLRTLNWLEVPDAGRIRIDDAEVDAARKPDKKQVSALRSKTAMVFQHYNLFKNKTALENVTAPLRIVQGVKKDEANERGRELLAKVGLAERSDQYPSTLSGGQQQRVGIARALAVNPKVILFDEPTSALDPEWVGEVLQVMRGIAEDGITMVVVSHEMRFVDSIATRVLFLSGGKILEDGTPQEVLRHPETPQAKTFLAQANLA